MLELVVLYDVFLCCMLLIALYLHEAVDRLCKYCFSITVREILFYRRKYSASSCLEMQQ